MNKFNFKRRNFITGPHLLGLALVVAGLFALVSPMFLKSESSLEKITVVGAGAILIGLIVVSSYGGTLIDFTKKKVKEYSSVCGYKFGEWTALPVITTVKVISTSNKSTNTPNGISPTLSGKTTDFRTLIYSSDPKPLLSFTYSNRKNAINDAERLATRLNAVLELNLPEEAVTRK